MDTANQAMIDNAVYTELDRIGEKFSATHIGEGPVDNTMCQLFTINVTRDLSRVVKEQPSLSGVKVCDASFDEDSVTCNVELTYAWGSKNTITATAVRKEI